MQKPDVILYSLLLCGMFILVTPSHAANVGKSGNSCVNCHSGLPGSSFIGAKSHSWTGSIHEQHGVTCDKCHGGDPRAADQKEAHAGVLISSNTESPVYFRNIPSMCGKCHGAEFYKFTQSRHYKILKSAGKGPECVTCHGSMVTRVLNPDSVAAVCGQCHNERMGIFPHVPQKAKAVLLLLRESAALLDAETKLHHPAEGSEGARAVSEARTSLHSARLDWHKFDLDSIIDELGDAYGSLKKLSPGSTLHQAR